MEQAISTLSVFRDVLASLGAKYKNVVVLSMDSGSISPAVRFRKLFPARHFHVGNAVSQVMSLASGMAVAGKIPVICGNMLFSCGDFFHHIRSVCISNLNIKIIGVSASMREDIAIMRPMTNMKIVCPADFRECVSVCDAIFADFGPTYLRLGRKPVPRIYDDTFMFSFGKMSVVSAGDDAVIFATGSSVDKAIDASSLLRKDGLYVAVVNVSSLKPLDKEGVVEYSQKAKRVFTLEDHSVIGGLGSAVCEILSERAPCFVYRMGFGLDSSAVAKTIKEILAFRCQVFQKSPLPL